MKPLPSPTRSPGRRGAFTLIELLVVLALMVIVIGMTLSSLQGMLGSSRLAQAGETVIGALSVARQEAISRNRDVEVRFITCKPFDNLHNQEDLRAIHVLTRNDESGWRSVTKPLVFANGIVGWREAGSSPLMKLPAVTPVASGSDADPMIGALQHNYTYRAFTFRADGSTDLAMRAEFQDEVDGQGGIFLTIVEELKVGQSTLPPNFVSISIQPRTGAVTAWRP